MASENNNLDISKIPTEDHEALAKEIERFYRSDANVKSQLSQAWERNHLFLDGKQWLQFQKSSGQAGGAWAPLQVSEANQYIPRPVTNFLFDVYQTLKSYLIKDHPRTKVHPNTQSHRDKVAAKIGTLCLEATYERLKEGQNYELAAACGIAYGTVIKKDYWNTSSLHMAKVPKMVMQPGPVDPMTGQPGPGQEIPALDEAGDPLYDLIPLGDVDTDIIEPFRFRLDPLANDLHKARWVMEDSIQPLDLVVEIYDKDPEQYPGFTGLAKELKEEQDLSGTLRRFVELKNSSGVADVAKFSSETGGSSNVPKHSVVLKEIYEAPSAKYPKGRMIVVGNGKTLFAGESPYEGSEMGDWHPYSEFRWEIVPGRFWGKGPLDDAIEIQKRINSIDATIVLTRKTMAIPQKKIPTGCGVAPGQWTGRPGQEIFYRADPSGASPEIIPATGVDATVFQERATSVEDMKQTTGAIDILKGDRPPGVTAASALNMLYEVGTGKIYPVLRRWKTFVESSDKKKLKLIAKFYKEPRKDFIQVLRRQNKELAPEEINRFIGTDLYDNMNVRIEASASVIQLQAAKQASLQEAAQTGALDLQRPENRIEYLRQMGISGFDGDVGKDLSRAEWENSMLDDINLSPDNMPIVLAVDNDDVHIFSHGERMKEPSFMALPAQCQQAYMQHITTHEQAKAQKMQAQMMQALAMGEDPAKGAPQGKQQEGPQGSTPMAKPKSQELGRGATSQQKNALRQDMLTPAPIGGGK